MRRLATGMLIGGAIAGMMVAAAYNDFDMEDMYRNNSRMYKKAKRKLNRSMRSMGIM